jgi:hypothetical protein
MAIRTEKQIAIIVNNAKANMFAKMMDYASSLTIGVTDQPSLERQSNLIWACESIYADINQKNVFADDISRSRFDVVQDDGLGAPNLFVNDL